MIGRLRHRSNAQDWDGAPLVVEGGKLTNVLVTVQQFSVLRKASGSAMMVKVTSRTKKRENGLQKVAAGVGVG
jgi:hypothetical protein